MIHLTRKEKLLVVALTSCVAGWALFAFTVKPAVARIKTLDRVIPQKQAELQQLRAKSKEYCKLCDKQDEVRAKISSQKETFELLPFLESLIQECGLTKKVVTMKQQVLQLEPNFYETVVEIKLESLTLAQLVNFLWKVESSNALARTKSLYIKNNLTNKNLLDSVVEIHNLALTQS